MFIFDEVVILHQNPPTKTYIAELKVSQKNWMKSADYIKLLNNLGGKTNGCKRCRSFKELVIKTW